MADIQAGRELDALVATRVMGWRWLSTTAKDACILVSPETVAMVDPKNRDRLFEVAPYEPLGRGPANYSTDIAEAWKVVEKMRERGFAFEIGSRFDDEDGEVASETDSYAQFARTQEELLTTAEYGVGAAPLAICLAALKAMAGSGTAKETEAAIDGLVEELQAAVSQAGS